MKIGEIEFGKIELTMIKWKIMLSLISDSNIDIFLPCYFQKYYEYLYYLYRI